MPKERPIETHTEKKVTLDPELEEALASASDTELYDLAGVWQDCLLVCFSLSVFSNSLPFQAVAHVLLSTVHRYG